MAKAKRSAHPLDELTMPVQPPPAQPLPPADDRTPWNKKDDDDPTKVQRKTYLISQGLIERIRDTADRNDIGQNELVRHLLTYALDQIDQGKHKLPIVTRNTLG